jgi:hypothetical protein
MKSRLLGAIGATTILATALTFTQGVAQANSVPEMANVTQTLFDANSGQIDFSWDENSEYAITGTEVLLKSDDISGGTLYEFVIPNFYDPLPKKTIRVSMEGANSGATEPERARVLDIIGADSDFNTGGPALPVDAQFDDGSGTSSVVKELWVMHPNPDFEIVKIFSPYEFELQSIYIETQSTIPVPAAVWLFGSGLIGMIAIARRRKTTLA